MRRFILTLCLVLLPVVAAAQSGPTVDQLIGLKRVGSPTISPDGKLVAYTVREPNWEENNYETEIWLVDVAAAKPRQLTNAKKSSSAPDWSPDGTRIAFLSDRSDKQQIWLISTVFGEAEQLTNEDDGVGGNFAWSPDGKQIAFTKAEPKADPAKERDKKYGEFEIVGGDQRLTHLWVIDLAAKKVRRLTQGAFTVGSFDWSPDGTQIAFDHAINPDPSSSGTTDISVVSVADGKIRPLVTQNGPDNRPVWSPDGTKVAFSSAMANPFNYFSNSHIAVIPSAGGAITDLTKTFDESPGLIAWHKDGIYFSASQHTWAYLYRLDPSTFKTTKLAPGTEWIMSGVSFTADAATIAFTATGPKQFPDTFVSLLATMGTVAPKKLTDMGAQTASWPQPTHEVITWKSTDGTPIEGILHKPANFQPGKRYPLLIVIHGGPTGTSRPVPFSSTTTYPIDIWLNKGAIVLEPNYRGSAGYGETFRSLNVRNLGIGDAWDVISGIDYLVAQGLADNDKVGTMGWSQGGYISAFLTTHDSARFKAVSVGAGISDWMTYYVSTDIHPFTRQYLKATPWDDPKIYADTSPMTYIKQAKAPTLIQHGELDKRVPIPNAYELYQGLQDQGVPAKLIVYKGFGHGLTKPKAHRAAMEHNLEWFGKYIWGETPAPTPTKITVAGVTNFTKIDESFASGGAVKPEAAADLKARGYAAVLNLRSADEPGANVDQEADAVRAAGMKYIHIPTSRTSTLVQPAIDQFLAAVADPANRPLFFHCGGGSRAAGFWMIKRVRIDGWTVDRAAIEADALGISATLKDAARAILK